MEERNLFSVSYKNSITSRRTARRIMYAMEAQQSPEATVWIQGYRDEVDKEMDQICRDIIDVLDNHVIPRSSPGEPKVFFLKMKGDYYRYNAEIKSEGEHACCANAANEAYA